MPNLTTRIEGGFDTGTCGATAVPSFTRVSMVGGLLVASPATEIGDGIMDVDAVPGQTDCRIHLTNCPGTKWGIALGAIAQNATVYAAANGAVSATGTVIVGRNTFAGVDGGIVQYHSRSVL